MNYKIIGEPLPAVVCNVEENETLITEKGAMSWMSPNMEMETKGTGGLGKMMGRMFAGESMFQNRYTAKNGPGLIAFASSFPGSIRAVELTPGRDIIVQKRSFLACEESVELSMHFQKKFGAGFFGGEGFILQRLSGNGTAFVEIDGYAVEYELSQGQEIILDTGYLAMMDATCSIDIRTVGGAKNAILGGEGIFNTVITGPGKVTIQTMPVYTVLAQMMVSSSN